MKEMVTLNKKEQRRLMVLNEMEGGKIIGREAAELLPESVKDEAIVLSLAIPSASPLAY